VELITTAIRFPNVPPLSPLSVFPSPALHHHPTSFFSQQMLSTSPSFFFCTLEVVLTTEKKKNKNQSLLNCSQCNNKLFILLVCTTVLLLFFSPFLTEIQVKCRNNLNQRAQTRSLVLQRKKKDEKKRQKLDLQRAKKPNQINSKLFKKCILFTAVQSKLLLQRVKSCLR